MSILVSALPYIQIILSIVLITSILFQQSGAGLGGALGGSDALNTYHTKRGLEKVFFYTSIVSGILFAITAFLSILLK